MATDNCRKVVVSNLLSDMSDSDSIALFFESKRYCPAGGEVSHVEMNANDRSAAVVIFKETSGNHTASSALLGAPPLCRTVVSNVRVRYDRLKLHVNIVIIN